MISHKFCTVFFLALALSFVFSDEEFEEFLERRGVSGGKYFQGVNGVSHGKGDYSFVWAKPVRSAEEFLEGDNHYHRRSEDDLPELEKRQWNTVTYNKADIQRQIDTTRGQRDNCFSIMGWTMPAPPPPAPAPQTSYTGGRGYWIPFGFGDRRRAYNNYYADAYMLNDLRQLQTQLQACQQAARATTTTTTTPDPRVSNLWRILEEAARQLNWCISMGGRSSIVPDQSSMKSYDLTKLDALNKAIIAEHTSCMAGIGRLPNGDFITRPPTTPTTTRRTTTTTTTTTTTPTTTTTRPTTTTTRPTTTTTRPTTTTTTPTTTTTRPTTTTTTPTTTTTTPTTTTTVTTTTTELTTTPGIFTTTIPSTTIC